MIASARIILAIIFVAIVTLALLPFHLAFLALKHRWRNRLPRYWHKAALLALGVHVRTHGTPGIGRPLLIVANHSSWLDILALASVADVAYVAKAEVHNWPVFGLLARLQRSIFIERQQRSRTQQQTNEMADRLNAGEIVVLFPEGTTSDGNRLLLIKSSLFGAATAAAVAADAGVVHVQPVAIAYTRIHGMPMGHYHRPIAAWPGDVELLPHLLGVLKEGALDVEIAFGAPVAATPTSSRKELASVAVEEIRQMMETMLRGRHH
ncbi:1-acyl-sn-glycerol-3-phosphate acyltransferase [Rhizobium sp. KVB221]|uniref:1-acyl-sn-glycerol-3-phosphate acyltransferase n=1 Tax=Rhizobium setariae TaxID=2801340 RepID=A0A937CQ78_9HYPH|nr:lysophospholipid acyltransferase family protein [Rhizobium setariae]MBL0372667.1 1-acyl-sn-glycerol-3-phosphate acyltransferase [Rhizobium setariae]